MISLDPRSTSSAQDNTGKASAPIVQNDSQLNSDSTDQSATNRKIGKDSASPQKVPRRVTAATWVVRLCFAFVFVVNVQCALGFALAPEAYMGAYELGGVPGRVATQGIGIAFLMWNCTYPLVIWRPERHRALASVVLAQQVVGLVGESLIRATLPAASTCSSPSTPSASFSWPPHGASFFCLKSAHALGFTPRRFAFLFFAKYCDC